jgi:hypothetical protein
MAKYRPYSRREFQRRFAHWARRNLKVVLTLTAGVLGMATLVTLVLTVVFSPTVFTWWFLGVLQATMVAIYLHLLHAAFLANDGEAIWHLRGAWGEENTRSELQRAKRKRLIWGWVDSIGLQAGDLDHLVVTRQGGLVAVDSKWRNKASDTIDMARAATKAKLRAEGLTHSLLKGDRGARHRAKINPLTVTPVVVLWGAAQHSVPDGARVENIEFVAGRRLVQWLGTLEGQPVSDAAAADIVKRLEEYRAATWDSTQIAVRQNSRLTPSRRHSKNESRRYT